jgi:hypothetical protein
LYIEIEVMANAAIATGTLKAIATANCVPRIKQTNPMIYIQYKATKIARTKIRASGIAQA